MKLTLIENVSKADELNKRLYSLAEVHKLKEYTTLIQVYHLLMHATKNIFTDISNNIHLLRGRGLKGRHERCT